MDTTDIASLENKLKRASRRIVCANDACFDAFVRYNIATAHFDNAFRALNDPSNQRAQRYVDTFNAARLALDHAIHSRADTKITLNAAIAKKQKIEQLLLQARTVPTAKE